MRWDATPRSNGHLYQILFILLTLIFVIIQYIIFTGTFDQIYLVLFFILDFLLLVLTMIAYYQYQSDQDYVEMIAEGIRFRSTALMFSGIFPKEEFIKYDDIHNVDLVEINSIMSQETKSLALVLQVKENKRFIIGNNLSNEQLVQIGVALKGTVSLSQNLKRYLGVKDVGKTFRTALDKAKNMWDQIKNGSDREQRRG